MKKKEEKEIRGEIKKNRLQVCKDLDRESDASCGSGLLLA